ncbi:MAG TPA: alanine dehydrogenase [bacterium]|nr:alanine dehydrogenase [bacterium]
MVIGCPKEIKAEEYRVGITPEICSYLTERKHEVLIEKGAEEGAGFPDIEYIRAGASIVDSPGELFSRVYLIVKVKEPQKEEISLISKGQILFTFFHFSANPEMTEMLVNKKVDCIAYELVEECNHRPILKPMSEIAGKLSIQQGMKYLEKEYGGKGVLIPPVEGTRGGRVVIIGGGTVGESAAIVACGIGAGVTIIEKNKERIKHLKSIFPDARVLESTHEVIMDAITKADIVVGAVLIPGHHAPILLSKESLSLMEQGTVIVDVSIDEGGIFETSKPTTHKDPVFIESGIVHYCVPNIPGVVPKTSTLALTYKTAPYIYLLAEKGLDACRENSALLKGLAISNGKIVNKDIASGFKNR